VALPSYGVTSAGVTLNLKDNLQVSFNVDNIFNVIGLTEGNPRQGQTQNAASMAISTPAASSGDLWRLADAPLLDGGAGLKGTPGAAISAQVERRMIKDFRCGPPPGSCWR
jgi:hypothetical protein